MPDLDDMELLARFVRDDSESAFAALVAHHVNLVYSAALRRSGNVHAAQEITQAVFIILARKARSLSPRTILSGWLYQTTRLTAANYLRGEVRRQHREQEAHMQSLLIQPPAQSGDHEQNWTRIAPLLEDAMAGLGEGDRNTLLLRYFENKSMPEIATTLRLPEATARKRLTRAVERLRKYFIRRGVTLSAGAITGAVSVHSVQAAPASLVATISTTAVKGSVVVASTLTLVKGTIDIMTWMKMKTAALIGVGIMFAAGAGALAVQEEQNRDQEKVIRAQEEILRTQMGDIRTQEQKLRTEAAQTNCPVEQKAKLQAELNQLRDRQNVFRKQLDGLRARQDVLRADQNKLRAEQNQINLPAH